MTQGASGYVSYSGGPFTGYYPGAGYYLNNGGAPPSTAPTQGTPIGSVGAGASPVSVPQNNTPQPNLGAYYSAPQGAPGAQPGGYNFAPGAGAGVVGQTQNPAVPGVTTPSAGIYGQSLTGPQAIQMMQEKYSITRDPNYNNYLVGAQQAQNAALYGQNVLNNPGAAGALNAQAAQAGATTGAQQAAYGNQGQALGMLQNAAAGNGPTAADIQGQQSISQAMKAQLTAGASARGGAYQQAAAQQQAGVNAAGIQAQGAAGAAQLRAQEQQNAQAQYAGASGAAVTAANQNYAAQAQALGGVTSAQQNEQGMGLNYYNQLANLYNQQSATAGNLASNQVANDYGLAGTSLQTSTQQNIANQQQQQSYIGAGIGALGMVAAALSTGGAEAAAKGAREQGVPEHEAVAIGTHVGQAIGKMRAPAPMVHAAKPADTAAARKGAMTPDEMHAHMAKLRAAGKKPPQLPGPATEPLAAHAYAAGSHLAQLAKVHAAAQHGRTHAVVGRP